MGLDFTVLITHNSLQYRHDVVEFMLLKYNDFIKTPNESARRISHHIMVQKYVGVKINNCYYKPVHQWLILALQSPALSDLMTEDHRGLSAHDHRLDIWVQPRTPGGTDQIVKGQRSQ